MSDIDRQRITFVLPVFNESRGIEEFYRRLTAAAGELEPRYHLEFFFVDDGSRDDSLDRLIDLRAVDPRVTVMSFSRNFGHQVAVTAGLDHADGDAVIVMDTDLQDPPAVSLELVSRWESGVDVAYAQRRTRKDGAFKRASAHAFYWLLSRLASIEIPRDVGDFRLLDRRVVLELRRYPEHHRFLRGLVSYVGFRQEAVLFDRDARFSGVTGYSLRKMFRLAVDGVVGFSTVPLHLISRLGFAISALSFVGVLYVLAVRFLAPQDAVPGWAFVTVAMFLLGGIQLIMLGVLGSYVGRTYVEVQHRPLYTVAMMLSDTVSPMTPPDRRE
ncbi:glycosyltransferase family 2 protein [Amnibacterium sp.]|uniref:glycosyltransferase family 2 protein n=1 Tax=Amnibacterium sp. TaxID=1872496 RepID=UPI00263060FD|nr:glycosyltransferase family 2 protein [Amnibacterium sp.]